MNDRYEELLRENVRLAQENNELLHKLWRAEVVRFWMKILVYAILIGTPVLIYRYYLGDYIQEWQDTFNAVQDASNQMQQLPPLKELPAAVLQQFLDPQPTTIE